MKDELMKPAEEQAGSKPAADIRLEEAAKTLRALAHPMRLKILKLIMENSPIAVNRIYKELFLSQAIASQQLRILREADLVHTEREGKFVFYKLNVHKVLTISEAVRKFAQE